MEVVAVVGVVGVVGCLGRRLTLMMVGGKWGEVEGWCRKLWREDLGYSLVLLRGKVMLGLRGVEEKEVGEETY